MRFLIVAIVLLSITACSGNNAPTDDGTAVVRAMMEAVDSRNLDGLDSLVSADVVRHSNATPGIVVTNLDEFKDFLRGDFASVPDSTQTIEVLFGNGEYVGVRATYAGTQQGPMGPFPATGKPLSIAFHGLLRIEDGVISEIWVEWDNLGALMQLGHISMPGVG